MTTVQPWPEHRDAVAAGVHHGFDREDHARDELRRRVVDREVVDVGLLVEAAADAVAAVVAHDGDAVLVGEGLTGDADVVETCRQDARPRCPPTSS